MENQIFELFTRNFKHIIKENDCFGWFLVEDGKVCGYLLSSIMFSTEVGGLAVVGGRVVC
ncbi:hypothetical protein [Erysipelothrix piscisicarius]|uniref:hypothetical protein n=1 Tax=Erysipelothrix piscisicarius TaxID=2485784 RepID=UPI002F9448E5